LQQKKESGKETKFSAGYGPGEGGKAEGERKWCSVPSQTFPEVARQAGETRPALLFPTSAFQTVFPAKRAERKSSHQITAKSALCFLPAPSSSLKETRNFSPTAAEQVAC